MPASRVGGAGSVQGSVRTLFAQPHSQVLSWGNWGPTSPDSGGFWAWIPNRDAYSLAESNLTPRAIPSPLHNLLCAGHAAPSNGDLLVISGTERGKTGEKRSARFDYLQREWSASSMQSGRAAG